MNIMLVRILKIGEVPERVAGGTGVCGGAEGVVGRCLLIFHRFIHRSFIDSSTDVFIDLSMGHCLADRPFSVFSLCVTCGCLVGQPFKSKPGLAHKLQLL